MVQLSIIPKAEFDRVRAAPLDPFERIALLADMCRANTLAEVKRAGSGHLGSSFSSLDIVAYLYFHEMNLERVGVGHPDRDIFFSSKGHDVPGLYAVFHALGILPPEQLLALRRLGGPCGHPDVGTPGVEANSGSLGMGISKARGMASAKALLGRGGRVFVMTGDGELQEGQIWESLQSAAARKAANLLVIVDHNKVQSERLVSEVVDLGDLERKWRDFGWETARCDGHDLRAIAAAIGRLQAVADRPKVLIADTIKGRGVSFMEHPSALASGGGIYRWHSGAPDDESFAAAARELTKRVAERCRRLGIPAPAADSVPPAEVARGLVTREYVAEAYGEALAELGDERPDLVVLDADLAGDCRLRSFAARHPARFIENGIAEQDMVSVAGGLALQGALPVVNTFAAFLASRANEQIYNNACEGTKIIYVCHYAGLIPAGPGQSHQSLRDISLLGTVPGVTILQPANAQETRQAIAWCVRAARGPCVLRLNIGPSPRLIELPPGGELAVGRGAALTTGGDGLLLAYGPVMLHEALTAAELLAPCGYRLRVVNLPWLNRVDGAWLAGIAADAGEIVVLEDHAPRGGLGDCLRERLLEDGVLGDRAFAVFGVEGLPAWGTPAEVLRFHRLDGASLAERVLALARARRGGAVVSSPP